MHGETSKFKHSVIIGKFYDLQLDNMTLFSENMTFIWPTKNDWGKK